MNSVASFTAFCLLWSSLLLTWVWKTPDVKRTLVWTTMHNPTLTFWLTKKKKKSWEWWGIKNTNPFKQKKKCVIKSNLMHVVHKNVIASFCGCCTTAFTSSLSHLGGKEGMTLGWSRTKTATIGLGEQKIQPKQSGEHRGLMGNWISLCLLLVKAMGFPDHRRRLGLTLTSLVVDY